MSGGQGAARGCVRILLPAEIRACLFDMDGVLTDTAAVHAAAWKKMFDGFLREWSARGGEHLAEFDLVADYREFIDGRQRSDGVRAFLAARGIDLPEGSPEDPPDAPTVAGLGNRKNQLVLALLDRDGVRVFDGSRRFLRAAAEAGLRTAVVSASANCEQVLEAAGLTQLFDARVDGVVAAREHLRGKPAPDMFLAAARIVGVRPAESAVFEDALAGVAAGRAGGFGLVVGVARSAGACDLRSRGADLVVSDLAELIAAG
jgi:beta-phosphoglucomutase family hydrolase